MDSNNSKHNSAEQQEVMLDDGFTDTGGTNADDANMSEVCDNSSEMNAAIREAAEWKDKYLRLSAEFDNYRKRTLREKIDLIALGGEEVITALLPVLDDIDRALAAMKETEDIASLRTGIELISDKLRGALGAKGLCEIEAIGNVLDTDFHDAVAKIAADKKQKGTVVDVVQKGYKLKDKVVRHAKCVIGE